MPTSEIKGLSVDQLEEMLELATEVSDTAIRENALLYYEPSNPIVINAHKSMANIIGIFGGNRSGKSVFGAVEMAILATGIVPKSLQSFYPVEKLRPDVRHGTRIRMVSTDFLNGVTKIAIPKLRDGDDYMGPLIPKTHLAGGTWEKAYSANNRILKVKRESQWSSKRKLTEYSTIEFMSYDQEIQKFGGTSRHATWMDELPPYEIWKECQMRHLDAHGRSILTLTPPDTTGDIAWVFDQIYEVGQRNHPRFNSEKIECFTIFTEDNRHLSPTEVQKIRENLTADEQETRLHGAFRHLAGLVYPQFRTIPAADGTVHVCEPPEIDADWPIVMVCDPHPRTPWAVIWAAIDPDDTVWVFDELWGGGESVADYAQLIRAHEGSFPTPVTIRLVDPAANQTSPTMYGSVNFLRELDNEGIRCKQGNNDFTVGRSRVVELLRNGPGGPRLRVSRNCTQTIYQLTHHIWAEFTISSVGRDPKQIPQERNKHFPDCIRYLAMENPRYGNWQRPYQNFHYNHRPGGPRVRHSPLYRTDL
jgi:phage terminase large subunit-like protein